MTSSLYTNLVAGEGSAERERLDLLAAAFDPATFAFLASLGVASGWRCLDAGAGSGSVARWLASRVAPGTVIAADRDLRFLSAAGEPALVVKELDLVAGDLRGRKPPAQDSDGTGGPGQSGDTGSD